MVHDPGLEVLVDRLAAQWPLQKRKMFGGMAYFVNGNMCFAIMNAELLFRAGKENAEKYLGQPGVHEAKMGARNMKNWLLAGDEVVLDEVELQKILAIGYEFAAGLPPKK